MLLDGRGDGVEPVDGTDEIVERFGGRHIFDAEREDGEAIADSAFDFLGNVFGGVGVGGEDQNHDFGGVDGVDDGFAIGSAGEDVARSNPAANPSGFEAGADGIRDCFVF